MTIFYRVQKSFQKSEVLESHVQDVIMTYVIRNIKISVFHSEIMCSLQRLARSSRSAGIFNRKELIKLVW